MADKPSATTDSPVVKPRSTFQPNVVPAVELLLIGGFGLMMLNYLLGWGPFGGSRGRRATIVTQSQTAPATQPAAPQAPLIQQPAQQTAAPPAQTSTTASAAGTHQVLCAAGDQGLNFRPSAGFSTPLFAIPCGKVVTVTGPVVRVQNETWAPVIYANRQGWSAAKLLKPMR